MSDIKIWSFIDVERQGNQPRAIFGAYRNQSGDICLKTVSRSLQQVDERIQILDEIPVHLIDDARKREQIEHYKTARFALMQARAALG